MSKKNRKIAKYFLPLYTKVVKKEAEVSPLPYQGPTFCGSPLKVKNVNQLWNWQTLEDVKF
jgi:hypothetical protein